MPSKASSKAGAATPKPAKPKAKPLKSSEYVGGSDLDSDEPMADAPAAKTSAKKQSEKTSKKRNRDGSEKVNGAGAASTKEAASKGAAAAKSTSGKKKGKEAVVVEVSSDGTSESESSEEEASGDEQADSSDGESESESSESTDSAPSKSKTTPATFKLPRDKDVPAGYTALDPTTSSSIPSSLQGKQIFLFTAPSQFDFSQLKKIKLHSGPDGEIVESQDTRFSIRRTADAASSSMKVILPREGKKGYQIASASPAVQFVITEAPPSLAQTQKQVDKVLPPPRAQPEGLRMRFMPSGYGEESDAHVNAAVLPPMDLVGDGIDDGEDVVMDDVEVIAEAPKKPKKKDEGPVETKDKKKKKAKAVESSVPATGEPENVDSEKPKSKKSKKDKGKDVDKEKPSKPDGEEGKKEKKKRKKDKS
ncbi:hypothetical protein DRE_02336 [Drechslerella stenobrocha 248]|uniref:Uncharacterized protein n=1 Tax=Drechslerella stenobrocha 248 TaxID=1043628 RepID=W7I805_9PEZI|nr:hypothetical protein DRE_02336 [Drechslerella stenobrocha 248]